MPERAKCKFYLFFSPLNPSNYRRRGEIIEEYRLLTTLLAGLAYGTF